MGSGPRRPPALVPCTATRPGSALRPECLRGRRGPRPAPSAPRRSCRRIGGRVALAAVRGLASQELDGRGQLHVGRQYGLGCQFRDLGLYFRQPGLAHYIFYAACQQRVQTLAGGEDAGGHRTFTGQNGCELLVGVDCGPGCVAVARLGHQSRDRRRRGRRRHIAGLGLQGLERAQGQEYRGVGCAPRYRARHLSLEWRQLGRRPPRQIAERRQSPLRRRRRGLSLHGADRPSRALRPSPQGAVCSRRPRGQLLRLPGGRQCAPLPGCGAQRRDRVGPRESHRPRRPARRLRDGHGEAAIAPHCRFELPHHLGQRERLGATGQELREAVRWRLRAVASRRRLVPIAVVLAAPASRQSRAVGPSLAESLCADPKSIRRPPQGSESPRASVLGPPAASAASSASSRRIIADLGMSSAGTSAVERVWRDGEGPSDWGARGGVPTGRAREGLPRASASALAVAWSAHAAKAPRAPALAAMPISARNSRAFFAAAAPRTPSTSSRACSATRQASPARREVVCWCRWACPVPPPRRVASMASATARLQRRQQPKRAQRACPAPSGCLGVVPARLEQGGVVIHRRCRGDALGFRHLRRLAEFRAAK
eukprot:2930971-Pleurochrysis_carterae.AAC.2